MTPLIGIAAAIGAYGAFKLLSKPKGDQVAAPAGSEPAVKGEVNLAAGVSVVDRSVKNPTEIMGSSSRVPSCADCAAAGETSAPTTSSGSTTAPPVGQETEGEVAAGGADAFSYPTSPKVAGTVNGAVGEEDIRLAVTSLGFTKPYF